MDSRENRINVSMQSSLSQGNFVFNGTVKNISKNGLMISDVPSKFKCTSEKCITIVDDGEINYKLTIVPTWCNGIGTCQEIGFAIVGGSMDWILMVNEMDKGKDIWYG